MTAQSKKLWAGLLIIAAVALISSAAVLGGIEWALASLGAMVLIGMIGTGINVLRIMVRYSKKSYKVRRLENSHLFDQFYDDDGIEYVTCNEPTEVAPINKRDKRLIMKHIDKLFTTDLEKRQDNPAETTQISKEDKRLIMKHIDELFTTDLEQSQERQSL